MNSIIVPTYNHGPLLKKCLESIRKNTDLTKNEVVVVTNGCKDDTESYVLSLGAPFRLISSREPLGFTRAVNIGIMAAMGENVVLLNDDAEILDWGSDWIGMLERPFADPTVAATGSTKDFWAKDRPFLVFFCVMIRKALLLRFGLLDEVFNPGAGEDCDFCLKCQNAGFKVLQVPADLNKWATQFPIYHVGHITCATVTGWDAIARRNTEILEQRYPRTDEDRQFQRDFSRGLQNSDVWAQKQSG